MRSHTLFSLLILAAASLTFGASQAKAAPGPNVNVSINGYLPAPPGVIVHVDAGRPFYVENDRRIYIERERPRHRSKHHGRDRRHQEEHAHGNGHDKHSSR